MLKILLEEIKKISKILISMHANQRIIIDQLSSFAMMSGNYEHSHYQMVSEDETEQYCKEEGAYSESK